MSSDMLSFCCQNDSTRVDIMQGGGRIKFFKDSCSYIIIKHPSIRIILGSNKMSSFWNLFAKLSDGDILSLMGMEISL